MQYGTWMTVARGQAGVISREQCLLAGLSPDQVGNLIARDALVKLSRGVFRVRAAPAREDTALWHAVLATQGHLMGAAAAFVWQLSADFPDRIEVLLPSRRRVDAPNQVRVRRLACGPAELTERFRLPVTSRARTVMDCAAFGCVPNPMALLDRALSQGWLTPADLEHRLARPVAGNRVLRQLVKRQLPGAEAESERRLHRLLRRAGIGGWVGNHPVIARGRTIARIDVAIEDVQLAIEVDGFAYHSDPGRFQRDRSRQNELVRLGWTVLRFTWADIVERPGYVVTTIRRQLSILESSAS